MNPQPGRRWTSAATVALALLALLAGCATQPPEPPGPPPHQELAAQADAALEDGRLAEAAELLEEAAALAPAPERPGLRLNAAELLWRLAEPNAVRRLLEGLKPSELAMRPAARYRLLQARLLRLDGRAEAGADLLAPGPAPGLPPGLRRQWLELQAALLEAAGEPLEAARTQDRLIPLLEGSEALERNRAALWQRLGEVPMEQLRALVPPPPDRFGGWLELAYLLREHALDAARLEREVNAWLERYPLHPGRAIARTELAAQLERLQPPRRIALLLPLSGRLASAGQAVQRGFLAAYYAAPAAQRPALRVFDVGDQGVDPLTAYRLAREWNAGLVVGPLTKEAVGRLAVRDDVPVPVLALNSLPQGETLPPGRFFQFGLAPEDDAAAAAVLAWDQGYRQVALLAPFSDWGERVAAAFRLAFSALGGQVVEEERYESGTSDFSIPLRALFNLDASERRHRELVSVLGRSLEFQPRRRADMDAIMLAAFPRAARLLVPQIRFHRGLDLAVLATSHAHAAGPGDAQANADMNGLLLVETPWLLLPPEQLEAAVPPQALARVWPQSRDRLPRLHALGEDAYRLSRFIRALPYAASSARISGATGALGVDPSSRVRRALPAGRFRDGQLTPLDDPPRYYGRGAGLR